MAFNPFHKFRKHQKVIFAGLTILCMLTFVACSGLSGDAGSWLTQLFGGTARDPVIAEVYGKKVTFKQMRELARQRLIANTYMMEATKAAVQKRMEELRTSGNQPADRDLINRLFGDPEFMQLQQRGNMQPYFGGGLDANALLDFKIWLHQADVLGIPKFTKEDITQEVRRLTLTTPTSKKFDDKVSGNIERLLRMQFRDFTPESLLTALSNEFRVRLAQTAILGLEPTSLSRMPAPFTPEEFWVFYKDNQTKIDVRLFPVKVEDFVPAVTEKPTEKDLKDLYEKYKNEEYKPESKEPGFKQPRRVQVEWVSGRSDSEFYTQAAKNYRPMMQAVSAVSGGFGSPAALLSAEPVCLPDVVVPAGRDAFGKDGTLLREYDNMKWPSFLAASYTRNWYLTRPYPIHDANIRKPLNAAAAIGLSISGDLSPVTAYTTFLANATLREMEGRTLRGTSWVMSGFQPGLPVMAAIVGGQLTPKEEYLPLAAVRDQVEQRLLKALSQDLLISNLRTVQKEIESKAKAADKDKKELREYLAKAVKDYKLQTGKTSEPRDLNKSKIADDPGLKPFREAYMHPAPIGDPQGKGFASLFFGDTKPYVPERFPRSESSLPEEDFRWRSGPESFLYWKTDDQPPRTLPLSDPDVKKEVERAWRFQKARDLAKKEADQLAKDALKEKGDARALRDFAVRHKKELIELPTMAKLTRQASVMPTSTMPRYDPPQISEDKVPYAGNKFVDTMLSLKEKPKGETLVQPDQPEATYYVAVLVEKSEPSLDDFLRLYRNSGSDSSFHRDPLLQMFEQERQVKYYRDVLAQLQKDGLKINEENMVRFKDALTE